MQIGQVLQQEVPAIGLASPQQELQVRQHISNVLA